MQATGLAKAKTKTTIKTVSANGNGNTPKAVQPDYILIPWKDLQISPTNPRRRIDEEKIKSLAGSIRLQGILEPLIVRQKEKKFEIVCGERRYRAAGVIPIVDENGKATGKTYILSALPCIVRELSDEQVLEIQIHENLHREDPHPMDEAYGYQFLKDRLGCDIKELALRVGKSESYVLNRLKLNLLIKEAQKDIDDSHLPLVYALEIAKYTPDIQKYIYAEVYETEGKYQDGNYIEVPIKGHTVPLKPLIEWINTHIHRRLSNAPFNPKATNLRPDGLACVKCPDRTGAAVSLFEPNQIGKKDACLNPACYQQKVESYVQVRRSELAEMAKVEPSAVPIVKSWCYTDGKDYLGSESAIVISGAKRSKPIKDCKHSVSAIDIEADNYGQTVQVCLKTRGCKTHWPDSNGSSKGNSSKAKSSEEEAAERLESHRARREEIWNAKVAEAVRIRVFKQAAESFEKKFRMTDVGTDFLPQLIAQFCRMTASGDSNNLNGVIRYLVAEWGDQSSSSDGTSIQGVRSGIESFQKLERGMQFRILFLLIHCHKGRIGHSNNYASQKEVRELAAEFDADYTLIDAEVRSEFCSKKHKQTHETYLDAVRKKSKDATIPHLFTDKWKRTD